jgi:hypothetical protein
MADGLDPIRIVDDTAAHLGSELPPERIEAIHDTLVEDEVLRSFGYAELTYLVIGNYDEGKKETLETARDVLNSRSSTHLAYLLEDVDPNLRTWENFYVKFKVIAARSSYVVAVFEDNDGGHELEVGEADREKTYVFKREYDSRETERAAYDAMIATLFEVMVNREQLFVWATREELLDLVSEHVP